MRTRRKKPKVDMPIIIEDSDSDTSTDSFESDVSINTLRDRLRARNIKERLMTEGADNSSSDEENEEETTALLKIKTERKDDEHSLMGINVKQEFLEQSDTHETRCYDLPTDINPSAVKSEPKKIVTEDKHNKQTDSNQDEITEAEEEEKSKDTHGETSLSLFNRPDSKRKKRATLEVTEKLTLFVRPEVMQKTRKVSDLKKLCVAGRVEDITKKKLKHMFPDSEDIKIQDNKSSAFVWFDCSMKVQKALEKYKDRSPYVVESGGTVTYKEAYVHPKRLVVLGIDSSMTKQKLQEIFPDAQRVRMTNSKKGERKAYLHFPDEKKCQKVLELFGEKSSLDQSDKYGRQGETTSMYQMNEEGNSAHILPVIVENILLPDLVQNVTNETGKTTSLAKQPYHEIEAISISEQTFYETEPKSPDKQTYNESEVIALAKQTYQETEAISFSKQTCNESEAISPAKRTYHETISNAKQTYDETEAITPAKRTCIKTETISPAKQTYTEIGTFSPAQPIYCNTGTIYCNTGTISLAQPTYNETEAISPAKQIYNETEAISPAKQTYNKTEAITPANQTYTEIRTFSFAQQIYCNTGTISHAQPTYNKREIISPAKQTYNETEAITPAKQTYTETETVCPAKLTCSDTGTISSAQPSYNKTEAISPAKQTYNKTEAITPAKQTYTETGTVCPAKLSYSDTGALSLAEHTCSETGTISPAKQTHNQTIYISSKTRNKAASEQVVYETRHISSTKQMVIEEKNVSSPRQADIEKKKVSSTKLAGIEDRNVSSFGLMDVEKKKVPPTNLVDSKASFVKTDLGTRKNNDHLAEKCDVSDNDEGEHLPEQVPDSKNEMKGSESSSSQDLTGSQGREPDGKSQLVPQEELCRRQNEEENSKANVQHTVKDIAGQAPQTEYLHRQLVKASEDGNLSVVKQLLSSLKNQGEEVCLTDALHAAVENNHHIVVEYFLQTGADVHAEDENLRVPLFTACFGNYFNHGMVKLLLKHGADPYRKNTARFSTLDLVLCSQLDNKNRLVDLMRGFNSASPNLVKENMGRKLPLLNQQETKQDSPSIEEMKHQSRQDPDQTKQDPSSMKETKSKTKLNSLAKNETKQQTELFSPPKKGAKHQSKSNSPARQEGKYLTSELIPDRQEPQAKEEEAQTVIECQICQIWFTSMRHKEVHLASKYHADKMQMIARRSCDDRKKQNLVQMTATRSSNDQKKIDLVDTGFSSASPNLVEESTGRKFSSLNQQQMKHDSPSIKEMKHQSRQDSDQTKQDSSSIKETKSQTKLDSPSIKETKSQTKLDSPSIKETKSPTKLDSPSIKETKSQTELNSLAKNETKQHTKLDSPAKNETKQRTILDSLAKNETKQRTILDSPAKNAKNETKQQTKLDSLAKDETKQHSPAKYETKQQTKIHSPTKKGAKHQAKSNSPSRQKGKYLASEMLPERQELQAKQVENVSFWKCEICQIRLGSFGQRKAHLASKYHADKMQMTASRSSDDRKKQTPMQMTVRGSSSNQKKKDLTNTDSDCKDCELCMCRFTSLRERERHLKGKKHKEMLRMAKRYLCYKEKDKQTAAGKAFPDLIEEAGVPNLQEPFRQKQFLGMSCDVCDVSFSSKNERQCHMYGKKHKKKMRRVLRANCKVSETGYEDQPKTTRKGLDNQENEQPLKMVMSGRNTYTTGEITDDEHDNQGKESGCLSPFADDGSLVTVGKRSSGDTVFEEPVTEISQVEKKEQGTVFQNSSKTESSEDLYIHINAPDQNVDTCKEKSKYDSISHMEQKPVDGKEKLCNLDGTHKIDQFQKPRIVDAADSDSIEAKTAVFPWVANRIQLKNFSFVQDSSVSSTSTEPETMKTTDIKNLATELKMKKGFQNKIQQKDGNFKCPCGSKIKCKKWKKSKKVFNRRKLIVQGFKKGSSKEEIRAMFRKASEVSFVGEKFEDRMHALVWFCEEEDLQNALKKYRFNKQIRVKMATASLGECRDDMITLHDLKIRERQRKTSGKFKF